MAVIEPSILTYAMDYKISVEEAATVTAALAAGVSSIILVIVDT
jgi:hypothetical protein